MSENGAIFGVIRACALGLNILVGPVQKISAKEISDIRRRVMGFVAKNPGSLHRFAFHLFSLYLI